jgi:chromosome segregation ATPase
MPTLAECITKYKKDWDDTKKMGNKGKERAELAQQLRELRRSKAMYKQEWYEQQLALRTERLTQAEATMRNKWGDENPVSLTIEVEKHEARINELDEQMRGLSSRIYKVRFVERGDYSGLKAEYLVLHSEYTKLSFARHQASIRLANYQADEQACRDAEKHLHELTEKKDSKYYTYEKQIDGTVKRTEWKPPYSNPTSFKKYCDARFTTDLETARIFSQVKVSKKRGNAPRKWDLGYVPT